MGSVLDAHNKAGEQVFSAARIPRQHGWSEQYAGAESMRMSTAGIGPETYASLINTRCPPSYAWYRLLASPNGQGS